MSDFSQRIGVVAIKVAAFEDVNGTWAKRPADCVRVRVVFADNVETFLTPQQFNALPKNQNELIQLAPSS
jgi:hypothetical protein